MNTSAHKKAILVVSFGTSYPKTREKNIEKTEQALAAAFPDRTFYHAYTSGMILKKLRTRDQLYIPNVTEAIKAMIADGVTDLLVQPTHILNGVENDEMKKDVLAFQSSFSSIAFGAPLLSSTEDQFQAIDVLMKELPALTATDALVFMGHGTSHYANTLYAALDYAFNQKGYDRVHVGTVEAYPSLTEVLEKLRNQEEVRHIYLAPLMLVAGDHASNDLAGDEPASWKSTLEDAGYQTTCILKGLGEYEDIRQLYVRHAQEAVKI